MVGALLMTRCELKARGLPWLLVQKLLDDAWVLEVDQRAGGCGDPRHDCELVELASALRDVAVDIARELGPQSFT
jgi:hypothetical protein